jgi:flagellar hook protein FlgE
MSDGTQFMRAQILLQQINRPENLQRIYPDVMLAEADAEPAPTLQAPGSAGLGSLEAGAFSSEKLSPLLTLLPSLGKQKISDEGVATMTGHYTDLAIRGPGVFVVRDPATSELFATRTGMFLLDRDGYVVTYDNKRLQGCNPIFADWTVGDIQLGLNTRVTTAPDAVMIFVSFEANGDVIAQYSDGTSSLEARIALYNFRQPDLLTPARLGQFSGVMAAQPYAVENVGRFGRGTTRIEQGQLELVNVSRDLLRLRRQLSFFPQGALFRTTNLTDLAIDGSGFFLLKHPLTGEKFVTRCGDFHLDASGHLVNAQSLRVQGISDVASSRIGDVRIAGRFSISRDGRINVFYSDGTQTNEGCVLLQMFKEPYQLRLVGHGLYQNLDAAAPVGLVFAGTYGVGGIELSALESSPEPESLSLPDRHGTRMLISGEPGSRWTIQAKEGRSRWKTIGVINNAAFETEFSDRDLNRNRHRVYRVLAEYAEAKSP